MKFTVRFELYFIWKSVEYFNFFFQWKWMIQICVRKRAPFFQGGFYWEYSSIRLILIFQSAESVYIRIVQITASSILRNRYCKTLDSFSQYPPVQIPTSRYFWERKLIRCSRTPYAHLNRTVSPFGHQIGHLQTSSDRC